MRVGTSAVLLLMILLPLRAAEVKFVGVTKYLNNARAVVTHTIDDSTKYVPAAIEAMDKYGIKATVFVSTERAPIAELWPVLRRAAGNGHEIGSHSRTHQCQWPGTEEWCRKAFTDSEVSGSRDDILRETKQAHVWSFAYPCGLCAGFGFVHEMLERARYLVARNYPDEAKGGHNVPDMQGWDPNRYNATYTQVVQKKGGIAPSGRSDAAEVNGKFDEVYEKGGIYNFLSHPQWLDYGTEGFYEQHLKHIAGRAEVWYVPMGPLYAYERVRERTQVRRRASGQFEVTNDLDPKAYGTSVTLEFRAPGISRVDANGRALEEKSGRMTDRWDREYWRRSGEMIYVTVRAKTVVRFRVKN